MFFSIYIFYQWHQAIWPTQNDEPQMTIAPVPRLKRVQSVFSKHSWLVSQGLHQIESIQNASAPLRANVRPLLLHWKNTLDAFYLRYTEAKTLLLYSSKTFREFYWSFSFYRLYLPLKKSNSSNLSTQIIYKYIWKSFRIIHIKIDGDVKIEVWDV